MVRVSFWENGKDSDDALPRYEDIDALNSAIACEKIKEKYPDAEILFWEWNGCNQARF